MDAQASVWTPGDRIILSAAETPVERELIERWAGAEQAQGQEIVDLRDGLLTNRLRTGDDPLLVPVRIAWLPKERGGRRQAGWTDLLRFRDPYRPSARRQGRIAEREADGYRVVVGEPARASDLRRRFQQRSPQDRNDPAALARFVVRQATVTLERAERALLGDRYKVPRLVVEEITASPHFHARAKALAGRLGMDVDEVTSKAVEGLDELVAVQSRVALDVFSTLMHPFHARAWTVRAEAGQLDELRELNRRHALVFLPSHRSYADTFVLAEVLDAHDFPRNHVVGGNNLAMWPLAPIARRAGVVFIRRSFRDDEIYKLAIQEYFGYLVTKRFNLEWYFEGGRSRTGKLRPPKYGLLAYVAAAVQAEPSSDVLLVPVSITYERLNEVGPMAAEQRGAEKQKEGLGWLARYARTQREDAGEAVVRFGPPVSMRERLPEPGPDGSFDEDEQRLALNKLAFDVAVGINAATPVLPNSLLTLALLGVGDRALTLGQVRAMLEPVLSYLEVRRIPTRGTERLRDPEGLTAALHGLERGGVVSIYAGGDEPVYSITPGQHLEAAFYRNNAIHWFVNRAIVELCMIAVAERPGPQPLADAWAEALRLRDLLKFEFFFPDKETFQQQLRDELDLIDPEWTSRAGSVDDVRELLAATGFLVAHRVLRSFVEADLVVAERLIGRPADEQLDEKTFVAQATGAGQQMLLQGRVHSAEALSRELFAAALKLAASRQLLTTDDPAQTHDYDDASAADALDRRRREFAAQVRDVAQRIALAADIDPA